jgi:nucleotide-binding universal stress UspA family protein
MFETILWATDGSDTAGAALPYALRLAEQADAHLVVAHVREIIAGRGGGYPVLADEEDVRVRIRSQVEELGSAGVDASLVIRTCTVGHVAKTLACIAREVEADVIVLGAHGYGRLAGLVVDSVTQGLVHAGPCPVLAIPAGVRVAEPERELAYAAHGGSR